jgi:hypothetical protein
LAKESCIESNGSNTLYQQVKTWMLFVIEILQN